MKCIYIIQPNDTILSIAEQFEVEPSKLIEMNHLQNYKIKRGDAIEIPSKKKT